MLGKQGECCRVSTGRHRGDVVDQARDGVLGLGQHRGLGVGQRGVGGGGRIQRIQVGREVLQLGDDACGVRQVGRQSLRAGRRPASSIRFRRTTHMVCHPVGNVCSDL